MAISPVCSICGHSTIYERDDGIYGCANPWCDSNVLYVACNDEAELRRAEEQNVRFIVDHQSAWCPNPLAHAVELDDVSTDTRAGGAGVSEGGAEG